MIIGDPSIFAIESQITKAYARSSFRGLGFFVIHIAGHIYGVREPDATMLAVSFDEVGRRLARRGEHSAPFALTPDPGNLADMYRNAVWSLDAGEELKSFADAISLGRIDWAPDGDEAFDDGSYVLQFDVEGWVRLIGFKSGEDGMRDPSTLSDVWLSSEQFYGVLEKWQADFLTEWTASDKAPE